MDVQQSADDAVAATVDAVTRFVGAGPCEAASFDRGRPPKAALWGHTPKLRRFDGHRRHILAISLRGDSCLEQIVNGRSVWRGAAPGTAALLAPGQECDWLVDGSFEMLHVYLEANQGDQYERAPATPFRDPVLWQMATGAAMMMRERTPTEPLRPLLSAIELYFQQKHCRCTTESRGRAGGLSGPAVRKVTQMVRDHLRVDLKVEDLAAAAGLSPSHFTRAFRQSFGMSPYHYILEQRVHTAGSLLTGTDLPIAEIARACGFVSSSHLGAHFRRANGISPREFRRQG